MTPGPCGSAGRGWAVVVHGPSQRRAERGRDAREQLEILVLEAAVGAVAVGLDPAPAAERVAAGHRRDVADPDGPHRLIPARRAREVAAGLGAHARRGIGAAGEHVLGREPVGRSTRARVIGRRRRRSRAARSRWPAAASRDRPAASTSDQSRSPAADRRPPRDAASRSQDPTRSAAPAAPGTGLARAPWPWWRQPTSARMPRKSQLCGIARTHAAALNSPQSLPNNGEREPWRADFQRNGVSERGARWPRSPWRSWWPPAS